MKLKEDAWRAMRKRLQEEEPEGEEKQPVPWNQYIWLVMILLTAIVIGHAAYISYLYHINPERVYGEWIELGMPPYDTENFTISEKGIIVENRYISTFFEFNGEKIYYYSGDEFYELQLYGRYDERLRRISGGEYQAIFVKKEYYHTILHPEDVGPGRRFIDMAEHFRD